MREAHDRIHAEVRHGGVRALAGHGHGELVHSRHHGPGRHADRAEVEVLPHVDPERGIGFGGFQHAVLDHGLGSAAGLLGGLEAQLDRAPQRVALAREAPREGEQDRGVAVVAACVHLSRRLRAVRDGVLLLDRERVHVGAQQHRPPGARAAHGGEHAGAADACAHRLGDKLDCGRG